MPPYAVRAWALELRQEAAGVARTYSSRIDIDALDSSDGDDYVIEGYRALLDVAEKRIELYEDVLRSIGADVARDALLSADA